jgi:hypothetical protein
MYSKIDVSKKLKPFIIGRGGVQYNRVCASIKLIKSPFLNNINHTCMLWMFRRGLGCGRFHHLADAYVEIPHHNMIKHNK